MKQLKYYDILKKMPKFDIDCVLYVCDISNDNLGLILRSADIFGANAIYYRQGYNIINNKRLSKLSRNSNIPIYFTDGIKPLLTLKDSGYSIAALEVTDTSMPLRDVTFQHKICLVIGNEQNGIPDDILNTADYSCHIEMIGKHISSLNVSVATSIALYEITQYYLLCKKTP